MKTPDHLKLSYDPATMHAVLTFNDWSFADHVETEHDMGWAFSHGDVAYSAANTLPGFIGMAFHVMQQCGGELTCAGRKVQAVQLDQCGGMDARPDWPVLVDGKLTTIGELTQQAGTITYAQWVQHVRVKSPFAIIHTFAGGDRVAYAGGEVVGKFSLLPPYAYVEWRGGRGYHQLEWTAVA